MVGRVIAETLLITSKVGLGGKLMPLILAGGFVQRLSGRASRV